MKKVPLDQLPGNRTGRASMSSGGSDRDGGYRFVAGRGAATALRRRGEAVARRGEGSGAIGGDEPRPAATFDREQSGLGQLTGIARMVHRRYGHMHLGDRYDLSTLSRGDTTFHCVIQRTSILAPRLPPACDARRVLEGCLESVWGIGPATAGFLRRSGTNSVRDLLDHARHGPRALEVLADHDAADLVAVSDRLTRRLGERGHLLSALSCAVVAPEEVIFLDLETMGLWNNVIFLVGLGRIRDGRLVVEQYLAPGFAEEPAIIATALAELATAKLVVTYNGRSADVPWLRNRAFYFGLGPLPRFAHVDLMYGTRRRFQRLEPRLRSVQLTLVSSDLLGLPRPEHDVDSMLIPLLYADYAADPRSRDGLLIPILDHNRADLEALVLLLERLCDEALATV